MRRNITLKELDIPGKVWDFAVIGGGATGLGIAVDAASRGYSVVLFEQSDFTKATSSRSTKLVHGGVRYLAQGDVGLVLEALKDPDCLTLGSKPAYANNFLGLLNLEISPISIRIIAPRV